MIVISDKYAIDFDLRNIILQEKYEKRSGKGKDAPLSGEIGYRDLTYHGTFKSLVDSLVEYELKVSGAEAVSLKEMLDSIERLKEEILEVLSSNIEDKRGD